MQIKENPSKTKRIYDKQTKTWFEVRHEQYEEYDRWRTRVRKREQYHHRCMCPRSKWWLCDGMCQDCEFRCAGDTISLDYTVENNAGDSYSLLGTLADPTPSMEDFVCDKAELIQLIERLLGLMPEAVQIGQLRQDGLSDEAIADIIGIKRTTFRSRLAKAKTILTEEYPDLF
jgi:DNA-directed RNA polymerase specialized sigma24 family protein